MKRCLLIFVLILTICMNCVAQTTVTHKIKRGETIYGIAKKYGVTIEMLMQANPDVGNNFREGVVLKIPVERNDEPTSTSTDNWNDVTPSEPYVPMTTEQPTEPVIISSREGGNGRKQCATLFQVGLAIGDLFGPGGKGFSPDLGYSFGIAEDFNNKGWLGLEFGVYYTQYKITFGENKNSSFNAKLRYLGFQTLLSPRIWSDDFGMELNLGVGYDIGLDAPVEYKNSSSSHSLSYSLFSGSKNNDAVLKDSSVALLYGISFKWNDGYLRCLVHHGITNIANVGSDKVNLFGAELAIGYMF